MFFGQGRGGELDSCFDRAGTPLPPCSLEKAARQIMLKAMEGRRGGGFGLDQGRDFMGNGGVDDRRVP